MATTTVGVEFQAKTSSAVADVDKLSDAIRESTTAADNAGTEQKKLGRAVAETRAQQDAAARAVRSAADAQRTHTLTVQAFGKDSREAAASAAKLNAANVEARRAAAASADALGQTARAARDAAEAEGDKLTPATKRAAAQLERMSHNTERAAGDLHKLELQAVAAARAADKGGRSFGSFLGSFGGNVAADAIGGITDKLRDGAMFVLETGASYETLRSALETTTGSSAKAASEFERLQRFAASTPFAVAELTEGYIKLAARGITPTDRALTAFGNTASSMGKSLDDMIEAVADAATGEMERLKEFGIVGKLAGDKVQLTFRGVTREVGRNAKDIVEYLTKLGEANFAGGMERQSQTLAGMFSTLADNAAAFADQVVQGGVGVALKEIMAGLTDATGNSESLARTLGKDLGDALRATAELVMFTASAAGTLARAWSVVSDSAKLVVGDFVDAEQATRRLLGEVDVLEERIFAAATSTDGATSALSRWTSETMLGVEAQARLAAAIRVTQLAAEEQASVAARTAAAAAARDREAAARAADDAAKAANAGRRAQEAELAALMGDKSLTPSERKRRNELAKDLDVALPGKGKKAKKDKGPSMSESLGAARDSFEQETAARERAWEAQQKILDAEQAAHERRVANVDRELELLDAQATREAERIDAVFYTIEIEGEAEARRRELQEQRMQREEELARWQVRTARTEADRAKAQTALEEVHHRRRVAQLARAAEDERKVHAKRQATVEAVTGHVVGLGDTLVAGIEAAVAGEKGAIAEGVSDYLKGVSVRMGIKGLEETVLAIAAAASYNFPAAAAHGTAAGMAFAASAAAGTGAAGFGAIGAARAGGGASAPRGADAASTSPRALPAGGGGGGGVGQRALEPLEVPISREDTRRPSATPASGPAIVINLSGNTFVGGASGKTAAAQIRRELERGKAQGRRT
jgi:hypothetical protein